MYKISLKKSARKELDSIPHSQFPKIDRAILSLKETPFPHPASKKLKGEDKRRLKAGDYRVVYTVDENDKVVTICRVRHRKESYR